MDQELKELLKSVADTQARQTDIVETLAKSNGNGDEHPGSPEQDTQTDQD